MKHFFLLVLSICTISINASFAQSALPTDSCKVRGYFFLSGGTSRDISMNKFITQIAPNRYEVILGDLAASGYKFQFDVNANNQLVNWVATGTTATNVPPPASGFMTQDDPGNFFPDFMFDNVPGFSGWDISTYNNTYDSVTNTLYMHYGYGVGSTGESGYTRQVYEKWSVKPRINSFSPASGTSLTEVTIRGRNFSFIDTSYSSVLFGGRTSDSFAILSDTILKAWIAFGRTGKITIYNPAGVDSSTDIFTFTPPPLVTDTQWRYLGAPGFSDSWTPWVNIACGSNNIPYVVYRDSLNGKALVKKYDGTNWVNVGSFVSDGNCASTNLIIDNNNTPVVAYQDSVNNNNITIKKFDGSNWITIGNAGFARWYTQTRLSPSIATDAANNLYTLSVDTAMNQTGDQVFIINLYKFNGTNWVRIGNTPVDTSYQSFANLAINKLSNTPYVVYDNRAQTGNNYPGQASVKKFDGSNWVQVGQTFINQYAWRGIYYPDIAIDHVGVPYISFQDDDGYERASVYKLAGSSWVPVGSPKFSHSHMYYSSLVIDTSNTPIILYRETSYNLSGSVLRFDNGDHAWKFLGQRGFGPSQTYDENSMTIDTHNHPMIAFGDYWHGGKTSVMIFIDNRTLHDSLCANGNISLHSDNSNAGNTYRWQLDNGTGFINVTNNAVYNGATTNTLNILNAPTLYYGYKYRCIIQNGLAIDTGYVHTLHFANTWTGAVSSAWENPANWSCNTVPDANTDVVINNGTIVISSNPTIHSLYTGIGVNITVSSGFNLTVLH